MIVNKFIKKGLPSFCTSNFDVLKIIIKFSKIHQLPVLIESTSNQVNQFGGYTGLTPATFKKKIEYIRKKEKLNKNYLLLGGDHLGPLPWKNLTEDRAMKNAGILIKKYVEAGFDKIHIDTAILCSGQKSLTRSKIISRCDALIKKINSNNLVNKILVVGTEVPFAGGGDHVKTSITKLENIKKEYQMYRMIFKTFKSLYRKTFGLVIDPGISYGNENITKSKFKNFNIKTKFSKKNNFVFEAHSSDYQSLKDLKKLNNLNFKFIKVGPELTFYYLKAALYMEKIESKLFHKKSNLKKIISIRMNKNQKYWKDYYKKRSEFFKFNSYLDRVRYYWSDKKVNNAKKMLFKNIDTIDVSKFIKINRLSQKDIYIKKKLNLSNADYLVYHYLKKSLEKYYLAFDYKLKKNFY